MGSSVGGNRRGFMMSDEELLRTIGKDLRSFYADIICQPLPPKIKAALARIDDENSSHQPDQASLTLVQNSSCAHLMIVTKAA